MKIYNSKIVIPGVIIFLALLTSPVWYNALTGQGSETPQLSIPTEEKQCVESTQWMEDHHMELLDSWRNSVVRDNDRIYTASDGKQYEASLETCIGCHQDTSNFCDQCHNYVGNSVNCWNCHNSPEGETSATE